MNEDKGTRHNASARDLAAWTEEVLALTQAQRLLEGLAENGHNSFVKRLKVGA